MVVLVIGAPRSGTSLVSNVIHKLGVNFGDPSRFVDPVIHPWNPIFFELQSLNDLNDQIIRGLGSEYLEVDCLPVKEDFSVEFIGRYTNKIIDFLKLEFNEVPLLGLKDPRFCLTLPLWLSVLRQSGYVVRIVWVVRNIASSLRSNKKLVDDSTPMRPERLVVLSSLIAAYMLESEEFYFCNYDDFVDYPEESVRNLSQWLNLSPGKLEDACRVIKPKLRNNLIESDDSLTPMLVKLSSLLLNRRLKAHHYLQFREQLVSYGYVSLINEKNKWLNTLRQEIKNKDTYIIGLIEELSSRDATLAKLTEELSSKNANLAKLTEELLSRNTSLARLSEELLLKDSNIAKLTDQLFFKNIQIAELNLAITDIRLSTSWRITAPLRRVAEAIKSPVRVFRNAGSNLFHLPKLSSLRSTFVQFGHAFYRRHLKRNRLGRWLGRQILELGLVQSLELKISALTLGSQLLDSPSVFHTASPAGEGEIVFQAKLSEADCAVPGFHLSQPLNLEISEKLAARPSINVLLPSLRMKHMSGGPNTALLFASMLAESGERIRLIACDAPTEGEDALFYPHMDNLIQRPVLRDQIELVDAFDRTRPTSIGINDLFFATAWWTAQIARYATSKTLYDTFIYLIQDYEPILHEGSTFQARAMETYGLPHIPLINTRLLLDHLVKEGAGRYAEPDFARSALTFEPALDRNYYFPEQTKMRQSEKKVLLFYARPTIARRNLFEIGLAALRQAVASGAINKESWEVWAMGESLSPVALGQGVYLNPLPWMNYEDYAKRVRTADLMLSLMLSPHPSYPPIEMAASGNLVVTNSFSVKTSQRLRAVSPNIIVAEPTTESISTALQNAAGRINAGLASYDPLGAITLPSKWEDSLGETLTSLLHRIRKLRETPPPSGVSRFLPSLYKPMTEYENYRLKSLNRRRQEGGYLQESGLLSFVTSAYNTDPVFLEELGRCVFLQDGGTQFEWLILDNGSTRSDTRLALQQLSSHPCVRLERVENNLGIIGGMRFCLEHAQGRYILPLDSDDIIEPDCVHVLTRFIVENNYPPLLYTDEDKLNANRFGLPYFKPEWDPVLFTHSCYIAHLCAIDREKAIELGLYSDSGAEGCHDWDSFIRFMNAGLQPFHIPEVLYSWRLHNESTSGNITSKSYITESHRNTLQRLLDHTGVPNIDLVNSPLFNYDVDWWFRRRRVAPRTIQKIIVCTKNSTNVVVDDEAAMPLPLVLNLNSKISDLAAIINQNDAELMHICIRGVVPDSDEGLWDAMGLFDMFPDAVMVGGTLHDGNNIIDGPRVFGFGDGFGCPDTGRSMMDPGYGAKIWKPHTVSAVPIEHCVIKTSFIKQCMAELQQESVSIEMLGLWLGGLAIEMKVRVVYSPFMRARTILNHNYNISQDDKAHFLSRFWSLIPDNRSYSLRLGLNKTKAYLEVDPEENQRHLLYLQEQLMPYHKWLEMRLRQRAVLYPITDRPVDISIVTPVYDGSDLELLDLLAISISSQTLSAFEWLIVINGPLSEVKMNLISAKIAGEWKARLIVEPEPIGIVASLRLGLEAARGEYVVPVDADDLITLDALQILSHEINRLGRPELVYTDEDLLLDNKPAAPYLRAAFDPILSLDNSTIWHMCAFRRDEALSSDVYGDASANWCQDWDTVSRIFASGGSIAHVPEVIYHWRQHAGSTTNNAQGDPRSLHSVRHILERHIKRTEMPQHFYVAEWPDNRGARELYIARHTDDMPQLVWIGDFVMNDNLSCEESAILVFTRNDVIIRSKQVFVEVTRLLELHPQVGAVGGLVEDNDGIVVDACYLISSAGLLECPWLGHPPGYSGHYALAQKPQSVAITGNSMAFFRIAALKQIGLWPLENHKFSSDLVVQWCGRFAKNGWTVAFSPLVRARTGLAHRHEQIRKRPPVGMAGGCHSLARYAMSRSFHC